ncbi:MAG: hypothetical protein ACKO3G_12475, partial [Planctomycetaceae bacterium]
SGLYEKTSRIFYGCNCNMCDVQLEEYFKRYDKVEPIMLSPHTKTHENLTVNAMIEFSKQNKDSYILYLHSKGITKKTKY